MLEVLYHRAKFGGARISPAAGAAKNIEFFVCYRQHCTQRKAPVFKLLLEADFEGFRPAGAIRCTDGGEIWKGTEGPRGSCQISLPSVQR